MKNILLILFAINILLINGQTINMKYRRKYQPPTYPIIFIPGIGGSILNSNDTFTQNKYERVWVTSLYQNSEAEKLLYDYNNTTQRFNYTQWEIYVDNKQNGLFSIYNLAPGEIYSSFTSYFETIIDHFIDYGYEPGNNLFGFPYDWRYSTNQSFVLDRLHELIIKNDKVIIIAHSMGGLLMENYIKQYNTSNIHLIVAISTPFKGAGGNALKAFLTGYNFGNVFLSESISKDIALKALSSYELLPQNHLMQHAKLYLNNNGEITEIKSFIKYFSQNNTNFQSNRFNLRNCFNSSVITVYVSTSKTNTPFDVIYDINYDTIDFTYIEGDGTVPIESSLNAECHGLSPLLNWDLNIDTEHVEILQHPKILYSLDMITENKCIMDGKYYSGNEIININNSSLIFNDNDQTIRLTVFNSTYNNFIVYRDCMHLKDPNTNVIYDRIIGTECNNSAILVPETGGTNSYFYTKNFAALVDLWRRLSGLKPSSDLAVKLFNNNNTECVYGFNHRIIYCDGINNIIVNNQCISILNNNVVNNTNNNNSNTNTSICPPGYYVNNSLCLKNSTNAPTYLCGDNYKFDGDKCVKQLYIGMAFLYGFIGLIIGIISTIAIGYFLIIKRNQRKDGYEIIT